MLFAVIRHDKPNSVALRQATRPRHLVYLEKVTHCIAYGGALLDDLGQQIGSILIIDVLDRDAAEQFAAADPFVEAGLFAATHILPFRQVFQDGTRLPGR
jgi:uncharacterized protein